MHKRPGSWACVRDVSDLENGEDLCAVRNGGVQGMETARELKFLVPKHHLPLIRKGNVASPTFVFT